MRSDSEMPMVEDVCRLQWLDARTCPIVSVALVRAHLPWWQQLIHRFHVWQRNEFQLQIILTISMHRVDIVIYRNKCKIYSKIEKRAFLLLLWPQWRSCLGLQMSPNWTFALLCVKFALCSNKSWSSKVCGQLRLKKGPPGGDAISRIQLLWPRCVLVRQETFILGQKWEVCSGNRWPSAALQSEDRGSPGNGVCAVD